jgi:phage repressor protein C with HTH and peptisase S24 domain
MGARPPDLTHERLWAAIDAIAAGHGLSPSALARRAGLSSTAFNKSKRVTSDGRPRWPSTESIAKVLEATGTGLAELVRLVVGAASDPESATALVPFADAPASPPGFAEADRATLDPAVRFPGPADDGVFAHRLDAEGAAPLYRPGDVLIVSAAAPLARGDRVLVRTVDGRVAVRLFLARNGRSCELAALVGRRRRLRLPATDVVWIARILWASQ